MPKKRLTIVIVIFVLLVTSLISYFAWSSQQVARATVLVVKLSPPAKEKSQDDYMSTQKVLLRSRVFADRVASSESINQRFLGPGIRSFPNVKTTDELASEIMSGLTIENETSGPLGNNLLSLKFRASDANDAKLILNAVVEEYKKYVSQVHPDSESMLKQLDEIRHELTGLLENPNRTAPQEDRVRLKNRYDELTKMLRESTADPSAVRIHVVVPPTTVR